MSSTAARPVEFTAPQLAVAVPPLEARGLTVRYPGAERARSEGPVTALDALDLVIHPGEVFCLLGANGAGKTTTINCFLGFVRPSAGTALVAGYDVAAAPVGTKRHLAYIPEQVMLYPNLTGVENLAYLAELATGRRFARAELAEHLVDAGLPEATLDGRVGTYSACVRFPGSPKRGRAWYAYTLTVVRSDGKSCPCTWYSSRRAWSCAVR